MSMYRTITDTRDHLTEVVDAAKDGRDTIITKHGVPVARVLSVEEYADLMRALA